MLNADDKKLDPTHSSDAIAIGIRLWSGFVLMAFLITHLINLALGLVSLDAMETGRRLFTAVWRMPVGTAALYGAFLIHAILSLRTVYQLHHFRLPIWEIIHILLGLTMPLLIASHVVGTRLASEFFGFKDSYQNIMLFYWVASPLTGVRQVLVLCIAWLHGCFGIYFWLQSKPWYPRFGNILLCCAVLIPVFSLLGFTQAGREVSRLASQSGWDQQTVQQALALSPSNIETSAKVLNGIFYGYAGLLGLSIMSWLLRHMRHRRGRKIRITYPGGKSIFVPEGYSILEASRQAAIPHAGECGGKGRCSTCRVSILKGSEFLPQASIEEKSILDLIDSPSDVRLACQLRPTHDISVAPLVPAASNAMYQNNVDGIMSGRELDVTVLFADLRGFTTIAEHKLPYDVVYFLNRYFDVVGSAIEIAGGTTNQFTGDGVMALFGTRTNSQVSCRQALEAVCGITDGLEALSAEMANELPGPLRIGIGIHTGQAVVGHMGHGIAKYLTAVGDTVQVASRLQDLTKTYKCQLIVSELLAKRAGIDVSSFPEHKIVVKNRSTPILIRVIEDIAQLGYCLYTEE